MLHKVGHYLLLGGVFFVTFPIWPATLNSLGASHPVETILQLSQSQLDVDTNTMLRLGMVFSIQKG